MKKILYFLGIMLAAWTFAACSEEEFEGTNGQLPLAEEIDATISVDQTTNQVTFRLNNKGCYPIWRIYKTPNKATVTTVNGYKDIIALAGTYTVEVQIGNRNGICNGYKTYEFTLDNTIVDWTPYVTFLAGGANKSKRWEMARTMANHLGCGPSGTDGLEWWHAGADEKAGTGLYEARMEFTNEGDGGSNVGVYKLDPADGGMIFVNAGVTDSPYGDTNPNDGNDFSVPFELIESEYTLSIEGTDLFIEFPAKVTLPYVASNYIMANPKYRVQSLDRNKMEIVSDEPGVIAWHYIFVPEGSQDTPAEPKFEGYDYNNANNLYRNAVPAFNECYTATGEGWTQMADPEVNVTPDLFTVNYAEAPGTQQWQAQVKIALPGLELNEGTDYDISMIVNSAGGDLPKATFKLVEIGDDGKFLFAESQAVPGFEDYVFHLETQKGISSNNLQFVFDFAGAPVGEIKISKITIIPHDLNPGPFPGVTPGPSVSWVDEASADNLMNSGALTLSSIFWADNNWSPIAEPGIEFTGNAARITVNEGNGGSQWQGQVHFNTGVAIEEGKSYDFKVLLNPSRDIAGVTVKPHPEGDDGNFFSEARHDIMLMEDNAIEYIDCSMGASTSNLVITFDFPACEAGTTIDVKGIIIQEHREGSGGGSSTSTVKWVDEFSADNLWYGQNPTMEFWWANNDWGQISDPDFEANNYVYTITAVEGCGGSQWQGQVKFHTDMTTSADKNYDFKICLNPTADIEGVTVKLTEDGNDNNFYTADRHDLISYDDNVIEFVDMPGKDMPKIMLVLDFAGTPTGAKIAVKNIILQEHK